jgi:hypothetical protein
MMPLLTIRNSGIACAAAAASCVALNALDNGNAMFD